MQQTLSSKVREYFERHLFGRLEVRALPLGEREIEVRSARRKIDVGLILSRARVVSPLQFSLGKLSCVHRGIKMKDFCARVMGGRVEKYAPGEIKTSKIPLKFSPKTRAWKKNFLALPQERRNRLSFVAEKLRPHHARELNLAYFYPIIEDNVARLVLNKQDGTLFLWYNPNGRAFSPKGLYMSKRMGDKDVNWRWI